MLDGLYLSADLVMPSPYPYFFIFVKPLGKAYGRNCFVEHITRHRTAIFEQL